MVSQNSHVHMGACTPASCVLSRERPGACYACIAESGCSGSTQLRLLVGRAVCDTAASKRCCRRLGHHLLKPLVAVRRLLLRTSPLLPAPLNARPREFAAARSHGPVLLQTTLLLTLALWLGLSRVAGCMAGNAVGGGAGGVS